jgi:hypothetical protein
LKSDPGGDNIPAQDSPAPGIQDGKVKRDRKTLGLVSSLIANNWGRGESALTYETRKLIEAGREVYGEVFLINPNLVSVELPRGDEAPRIYHDGRPMPEINSLIIRSTYRLGGGLNATIRCLALQGCDILDRIGLQGGRRSGKLGTSIKRFSEGVGSTTYLAFGRSAAEDLAKRLDRAGRFPLIAKPIGGSGGKGVVKLDDRQELLQYVRSFYSKKKRTPLMLQPFEKFVNEFRVVLFFGQPLGTARKIPAEGSVAANAAQGGTFVLAERPDIVDYACSSVSKVGIFGVDIGETAKDGLRIIEANRAPRWEAFDRALSCDTARAIVTLARKRLDSPPS